MHTWDVMGRGADGGDHRLGSHDTRVGALAQVLALECAEGADGQRAAPRPPHGGPYRVCGPPCPTCRTNRDLYLHFLQLGQEARGAAWSLSAYLRSLWKAGGPLSGHDRLEPDQIAAMFTAAAATPPPPYDPRWSTYDLSLPGGREPEGHPDWERVILSQLADLEDFAANPRARTRSGVDAPRPAGGRRRATPARWLNFDPASYLECAVVGSLGDRNARDGARVPSRAGRATLVTRCEVRPITTMSWSDLARIAVYGQMYE